MHVPSLAADESLVSLDFAAIAADLHHGAVRHRLADAVKHEPCGFLGDAKGPGEFAGANAILCGSDEPHGGKPSLKAQRRILKDGPDLGGELPLRMGALALPSILVRQIGYILAATGRAFHALGPAMRRHVGQAIRRICEVNDGLLECLWGFHDLRIGQFI